MATTDQFYKNGKRRWTPNKSWSQKRIQQWLIESPMAGRVSFDLDSDWDEDARVERETISVYLKPGWTFDHAHCTCNKFYSDLRSDFEVYPCDCELCAGDGDSGENLTVAGEHEEPGGLRDQRRTNTGKFEGYKELVKQWEADHSEGAE